MTVTSTVIITSPPEAEQVARRCALNPRLEMIPEPDLLPEPRCLAGHKGKPFLRQGGALSRWHAELTCADIL